MYVFLMAQFDQSNSEIIQHRSRVKEHPELALYSELILYLFHTKAGSPIHMWSTRQLTISEIESKIPTDIKSASMSAMREGVGALLDVLETNSLEPWQVAVVKLHKHVVRTGCKDTTLALEQHVLNFLANAPTSKSALLYCNGMPPTCGDHISCDLLPLEAKHAGKPNAMSKRGKDRRGQP